VTAPGWDGTAAGALLATRRGEAMKIGVITNPHSRKNKGRGGRALKLAQLLGPVGEVRETETVADIKPVLRDLVARGARYVVADGGDGAFHWVARGLFELAEEPALAGVPMPMAVPTNGGTIDYVASNVGITGNAETILASLRDAVEQGQRFEEVEIDSMRIDGTAVTERGVEAFRTFGFGSAVGGVGQRFYAKYYADPDPNPRTIVKVVGATIASLAMTPVSGLPGFPDELRRYARELFRPASCRVTIDGRTLPYDAFTGVHIAAMSLDYHGVFKLFPDADRPGALQALVGAASPLGIVRNLPNMHLGRRLSGARIEDRVCGEMVVEALGDESLEPIIDGEYYRDLRSIKFELGPRLRIPRVAADARARRAA
jgi:diacylglycerol kinase family enzyme